MTDQPPLPLRQPKVLRHPVERPAIVHIPPNAPPAWWVGVPREDFAAKLKEQIDRMVSSREARWVNGDVRDSA